MENKTWKFELHITGEHYIDKTFRFEVKADEQEAQVLFDAIILGAEMIDLKIGGGYVGASNE